MSAFFVYILKSAVCLALLYLFYCILLSKETFYRYNRATLLCLIPLSFVLPALQIPALEPASPQTTILQLDTLPTVSYSVEEAARHTPAVAVTIVLCLYFAGVLFFALRYAYTIMKLLRLIRSGRKVREDEGRSLVILSQSIAPFSWFGKIVLSEADYETHSREILLHESAHIRKRHSFDLLAADLCIGVQWFNPAAWLLKRELQTVHEYEADDEVLAQGINARQYQLLLIKRAAGSKFYCVTNHFNHNKLNKRITMMLKKKSTRKATWKYLYMIPVALCTVTVFAQPEVSERLDKIASTNLMAMLAPTDHPSAKAEDTDKPLTRTDKKQITVTRADKPDSISVSENMNISITENGRPLSMDSALYILNGKKILHGQINNISSDQIKSVTIFKGEQAVKKYGEEGKHGVVVIDTRDSAIPTTYATQITISECEDIAIPENSQEWPEDIIVLIDSTKVSRLNFKDFKNLNPDSIANITVFKNDDGIQAKYGISGQKKVIVITTKKEK